MTDVTSTSRILTLVFTDLADSTALKTQRGDQTVGELIRRHRAHVQRLAVDAGGSIIDWAGDGCFLTFETASAAVVFALRLQQIHKFEAELPGVRIGVHMGEVSLRDVGGAPRVEGLSVDLAARISGLASGGQVLISNAVGQSAKPRLGIYEFGQPIRWENYGPYVLKGFDEPMEICEAGLENLSPLLAPRASDKAWPKDEPRSASLTGPAVAGDVIRKIAVLPLANMSGDPSQEYFADGMTEAIITELAKIKALRVISRTSVMQYRNATKSMSTDMGPAARSSTFPSSGTTARDRWKHDRDEALRALTYFEVGTAEGFAGNLDACERGLEESLRNTPRSIVFEAAMLRAVAHAWRADVLQYRGRGEEGVVDIARAREVAVSADPLARAQVAVGNDDAVDPLLARAESMIAAIGAVKLHPYLAEIRAERAFRHGDQARWQAELDTACHLFAEMGAPGHAQRVGRQLAAVRPQATER